MKAPALAFLGLAVFALAGCGGTQLAPPGMVTVPQVRALQVSTAAIAPGELHDFYVNGKTLVLMNCGGFFDQAVMNALSNAQTASQTQLITGLASGVLGLAGVGGPAVGGVGLGASFLSNMLASQQQNSLAGTDPAGVYTLTTTAQQAVIDAMTEPTTGAEAYAALYAVYRQCTPAGIQALKEQAINAAPQRVGIVGGSAPAALRAAPATGDFVAPVVPAPRPRRALPMVRIN